MATADSRLQKIRDFLSAYLDTTQRIAQRFSDRDDIFAEHFLSPFSIIAYSCRDGLVIDFVEAAERNKVGIRSVQSHSMGEVLSSVTFGLFNFKAKAPDHPTSRPALTLTRFVVRNTKADRERYICLVWLWWKQDVDKWSTGDGLDMALRDAQSYLTWYGLGSPGKPLAGKALDDLQRILDEYEKLLIAPNLPERDLQQFLTAHPIILTPAFETVIPKQQIGCGKQYEIDFVIRQEAERYLVVEIEKPSTPLFTKGGNFTADFNHAERQMIDFLGWIDENLATARTVMPGIKDPLGLVVIGRRSGLDYANQARLQKKNASTRSSHEFVTFDDLLTKGKLLTRALDSIGGGSQSVG